MFFFFSIVLEKRLNLAGKREVVRKMSSRTSEKVSEIKILRTIE